MFTLYLYDSMLTAYTKEVYSCIELTGLNIERLGVVFFLQFNGKITSLELLSDTNLRSRTLIFGI